MPFIGKNPTAGFATIVKDDFTADGTTTVFTLSKQVATVTDIAVYVGNVRQEPTDAYTVNGTTLTMSAAPATGVNFYVLHIAGTIESSVVPADLSIGTAKLVNNAVTSAKLDTNIDVAGTLDVTGATTLDSTLAVVGNSTANSINLGGRTLGAGGTPLGVNFSSASTNGMQINDTNSGNLGGMLGFYSGSGTGTLRGNIQNANNAGIHVCVGTGGTVVFGNSGYTAANALDDYEEGTFTPTLYHTSTNDSTFSLSNGQYTKIGNTVTCQIRVDGGTSGTAGSFLVIGGLPFAVSQAQGNMGIGIWGSNPSSQVGNIHGFNPPRVFKGGQDVTTQMSFFTAMLVYKTS